MTNERLKILLCNAIVLFNQECFIFEDLEKEMGITADEYKEIMSVDNE